MPACAGLVRVVGRDMEKSEKVFCFIYMVMRDGLSPKYPRVGYERAVDI